MIQQNEAWKTAAQRHWIYGFNVVALMLAGLAILGILFYLSSQKEYSYRRDLTSGGVYSLSESSKKLLAQLDTKAEKYELINLKGSQEVSDLLTEYQRASKNITAKNFSLMAEEDLENQIKTRYTEELKPYVATVGEFPQLAKEIEAFMTRESADLGALLQQKGLSAEDKARTSEIIGLFSGTFPATLKQGQKFVDNEINSTSPRWTLAVGTISALFESTDFAPLLEVLADAQKVKELFGGPTREHLLANTKRFEDLNAKVKSYTQRLAKLAPLKVREVLNSLKTGSVVVLSSSSAKVIGRGEMFKVQGSAKAGSDEPTESFEGEQAISSVLLSLHEPVKKKVVFVTAAAQQVLAGQFSAIAGRLRDANFEALEWSAGGGMNPMTGEPEAGGPPPGIGAGVVWVVMPPEQANPQMAAMGIPAGPPPPALMEALKAHVAMGGDVMFLAEATPASRFSPGPSGFPYEEITKPWGINVASKYTVVHSYPSEDSTVAVPQLELKRFPKHPITQPQQGLMTVFVARMIPRMGYTASPTVVRIDATSKPSDVTAEVIVDTGDDPEAWGESALTEDAKFEEGLDVKGPVPMGVAAWRTRAINGKNVTQRMVVIGSKTFAFTELVERAARVRYNDRLYEIAAFPGNAELFVNSTRWLAGYENMIAVSSKSSVALRIRDISPGALAWIRWGVLFAGAPTAALIAGLVVWAFRRR